MKFKNRGLASPLEESHIALLDRSHSRAVANIDFKFEFLRLGFRILALNSKSATSLAGSPGLRGLIVYLKFGNIF